MKTRISVGLCLVMVLLVAMGAHAATAAPPPAVEKIINEAQHGQRVEVKGEILVLNLEGNPSTGYAWQVEGVDGAVLRQVGRPEWVSRGPARLGAPATQVLRFAGVGRGVTTLDLAYVRPWARGAGPAKTYRVEVQVSQPSPKVAEPAAPQDEPAASVPTLGALPGSYNWCALGGCTPVRDQGACGSCWAFGTVGPLESAILLKDGVSRDLSEQYLVSCNIDGWGCDGGWWAHDYHEWKYPPSETTAGAVYEADFRYTATDAPCNGPYTHHEKIADWVFIGSESAVAPVDAIKQAIVDHGPVSAAVCVNTDFQGYTGGVFNPTRPCRQINHAIVLVGWDDSKGAWLLRNSWGPDWGEDGYMWIAYGKSQVGYSANYVVYGSSTPTPTPTAPPPDGTVHVSAIDMWYSTAGKNYVVYTRVTVVDEDNLPVSAATVSIQMTSPTGSTATGSAATGADGTATFSLKNKAKGTYTSQVTNVTHATYTYAPADNVETTESLVVP